MNDKSGFNYLIAPIISIIAFLLLIGSASYAYFTQSVGSATGAANIANANLIVPRGCTFLANATNCVITANNATTTAFTDSVITRAEMSQKYAGNSVAQSTCTLNIGVQGTTGCKCNYTVSLEGQTTTNIIPDSLMVTINKASTAQTLLPSDYQQVEYITLSGSQRLHTGFLFNISTDGFLVTFKASTTSQNGMILADSNASSSYIWAYYYNAGSRIGTWAKATSGALSSSASPVDLNKHVMSMSGKKAFFDYNQTANWTSSSFGTPVNELLIGSNYYNSNYNYYFKGNIYEVILYRNDVIQMDFIPCYRKSDNVVGMYDIINDNFIVNQGSGSITAGPNTSKIGVIHPFKSSGTITVASTGTAVHEQFNLTLNAYNSEISQDYQAGNSFIYRLKANPTCTIS